MRLFRISQTATFGWDTYSDAVVCAEDLEEARSMHPDTRFAGKNYEASIILEAADSFYERTWTSDWAAPYNVSVQYLGEADESVPKGVVCASYHAG